MKNVDNYGRPIEQQKISVATMKDIKFILRKRIKSFLSLSQSSIVTRD